jgi:hypothetical protein
MRGRSVPLSHLAGSRQRGVEQRLNCSTGGRRDFEVVVVHVACESGAVVDEMELASETDGIAGAGLLGESVNMARIQARNWPAVWSTIPPGGASVEAALNAQPFQSSCSYSCAWVSKTARIFCRGSSTLSIALVSPLVVRSWREAR